MANKTKYSKELIDSIMKDLAEQLGGKFWERGEMKRFVVKK